MKVYEISYCIPFHGSVKISADSKDDAMERLFDLSANELLDNFHELGIPYLCKECDIEEVSNSTN